MIYTTQTTQTFKTVKNELEAKAKKIGFDVLDSYSFKEKLYGKNFPIEKDIIIFELCNPFITQQALTHFAEISVFLPCCISIYEEDGQTVLSTMGIKDLLDTAEVDDGFQTYMTIIFENLKRVMHSWDTASAVLEDSHHISTLEAIS